MSVVDIDRTKPFTKETSFAILSIVGLTAEELDGILTPEEAAEFAAWEEKSTQQETKSGFVFRNKNGNE